MSEDYYFISDLHLFHQNILNFTSRGFNSLDEMHEHIIENWNSCISEDATIFHLGDLSFSKGKNHHDLYNILNHLNGQIICLKGNHDHQKKWNHHNRQIGSQLRKKVHFEYTPYKEITIQKQFIVLCHYPIISWNKKDYGSIHLHGHTHGNLNLNVENLLDVGYDNLLRYGYFRPVHFNEALQIIDENNEALNNEPKI